MWTSSSGKETIIIRINKNVIKKYSFFPLVSSLANIFPVSIHNFRLHLWLKPVCTNLVLLTLTRTTFKPGVRGEMLRVHRVVMSVCTSWLESRSFVMKISLHFGNNGPKLGWGHRVKACNFHSYWFRRNVLSVTFDFNCMLSLHVHCV